MLGRQVKQIDKHINVLTFILIPFSILLIYYGLIVSNRYTSDAIVTIKENSAQATGLDIGILGFNNPTGLEDERIMSEYVQSGDMFFYLDEKIGLKKHYQGDAVDWFSSLSKNATKEKSIEFYRDHINIYLDDITGLVSIEVQAFDNQYANLLLNTMLQRSEEVVNGISHRLAMAQYNFVEEQLSKTQITLKQAKQDLLQFQNKYQMFSPEQEGQALTAIMDTLQGQLSQENANLKQILSHQKPGSPQAIASKEKIRALRAQIVDEKRRLVGEGDEEINDLMVEYTNLELDLTFAKDAYASALAALETSRAEVSKKLKHLVIISSPSLADQAKYPDRVYIMITALIVLAMLFGVIKMVIKTIREHQD